MRHRLSILIIASLPMKGMKSAGNTALLEYSKKTLIEYHINNLLSVFPNADIVVVGGFEYKKLKKITQKYPVRFIHHDITDDMNEAYSLLYGLKYIKYSKLLVLDVNMIIQPKIWKKIVFGKSSSVFINNHESYDGKLGAVIQNGCVENIFFSLPNKLINLFYFNKKHIKLLLDFESNHRSKFIFELLNMTLAKEPIKYQIINSSSSCLYRRSLC